MHYLTVSALLIGSTLFCGSASADDTEASVREEFLKPIKERMIEGGGTILSEGVSTLAAGESMRALHSLTQGGSYGVIAFLASPGCKGATVLARAMDDSWSESKSMSYPVAEGLDWVPATSGDYEVKVIVDEVEGSCIAGLLLISVPG
jgi:hypothetical protein